MPSTRRISRKGRLLAFSALLLVAALALVIAPISSQAASNLLHFGAAGQSAPHRVTRLLSPHVPPVFGPNVRANSDSTNFGQHEPSLAVSRVNTNTVVVAAKDYRNGNVKQVWIDVSNDGGATWPVEKQFQIPGIPADLTTQSDPVVMARDDGRIYVAALGTNTSQTRGGIFITWTDDEGATWQNPSVQVFYPENALDDKEWFAIDNNPASPYYHRMYMMYAPSASYVVEQHSTDGGLTWSTRQQIGTTNTEYTYPVIASDGTVYNFMMLNWGPSRVGTVQMTKSTNGGVTWTTPTTVTTAQQPASPIRGSDQFRFFAILSAAVDPNNGALYVAWTDNRNFSSNGTDVVYVKSTDGGASWGPITRLSHDPPGVVRDHITPMLAVGEDSRLHAFWLDRRLDPNNRLFDSWYSSSTDGGATWDPDTRVSTEPQDLNLGFPPGSGNAAGDYWGLDVWRDTVYVAWNDTRLNGQQDILVAKGIMQGGGTATPSPSLTPAPPTLTATNVPASQTATTVPASNTPTATVTTVPIQQCSPIWRIIPSQNPGSVRNLFGGVAAVAPDDIWAVGGYSSEPGYYAGGRTLIQHWDGTEWRTVPSPNVSNDFNRLHAVHALSANDIWAVGEFDAGIAFLDQPQTLTMHWDGTSWTVVPSPNTGALMQGTLLDVEMVSHNDVWAVGHTYDSSAEPFTMHWDGTQWSIVPAPLGASQSCYLYGVDALSTADIWAVGYCIGQDPATIVLRTLTLHWNGAQWNIIPSPNPGQSGRGTTLSGIEAISPNNIWAVGVYDEGRSLEYLEAKSLVLHWNGTGWTHVPSPNVPSVANRLNAISAVASDDIWAVGSAYENGRSADPTSMHWDGSQWSFVQTQATGTGFSSLAGLEALSTNNVWAVGFMATDDPTPVERTLVEHYSIGQFSDVTPSNTFYENVQCLACRGIISGYADGTFRPNNPVTRGQLAKIVSSSGGFNESPDPQIFQDVPPSDTFYQWINRLTRRGYMTGYLCGGLSEPCGIEHRPYFRPYANATRGQTSKIVSNAAGFTEPPVGQTFEDVPPTHTFYEFIQRLAARDVMQGYQCGGPGEPCTTGRPYFRPGNNVTRGQSAKIVANTFFPGCQSVHP